MGIRFVVCMRVALIVAFAQATILSAVQLSDSPAGRLIEDYIAALNSGQETAMRAFLEGNVAPAALKDRPVGPRLGIMKDLFARLGSMTIRNVTAITDTTLTTLVETKNGDWIEFTMFHGRSSPAKMLGIGIQDAERPTDVNPAPLTDAQLLMEAAEVTEESSNSDEFSGVVLIALNGKPVFHRACGFADIGLAAPNRPDTKFNLGSINKKFTQLAIDLLVERGKLSYADKIGRYLEDYPNQEAAANVTVGHLVKMQGGIGDFFGDAFENTPKDRIRHNRDFIPLFANQELHFEPGSDSEYSNGGYILLGAIIEKVTGQDYYDFIRDNIFVPAGMENTAWYEADACVPNLAQGYTKQISPDGTRRSNIYSRPARGSAAGGGYSTAEDLLKFVNAVAEGKFGELGEAYRGLGIAGGAPGINAALESDLKGGYTVIVLSNYDPPSAERLARVLRQLVTRVTR